MDALVGYTGFVGGNIASVHKFDRLYNSKNISESFGTKPDLLVYAGVPAEMFLANSDPEADRRVTENAVENIQKINPKRLVLISTIAVLDNPVKTDESCEIDSKKLTDYGLNRLNLETEVRDIIPCCHIIRLPALFGMRIKKNFICDMINFLPPMLNKAKFEELSEKETIIAKNYFLQENGFYKLTDTKEDRAELKSAFERCNFSALSFTDSCSIFQYYNLSYLWKHIETVIGHNIPLLNAAVAPISAADIYEYIFRRSFTNKLAKPPFFYDFRTQYAELFGGENGYIFNRVQVLYELKLFVEENAL